MKVKMLIDLLMDENQDAEVFAYLAAESVGFKVVEIGQKGGAVIGKGKTDDNRSFVLLPIEVPAEFEPWEDASPYPPTHLKKLQEELKS